MRPVIILRLVLPLLLLSLLWVTGRAAESIPSPPQVPVRAYVLMDFYSGDILAQDNGDVRMEPASITKLMTGYILYKNLKEGHIKLTDQVTISDKAWRTGGSRMFVQVGTKVALEDLIMGMDVQSGNDATVALAEDVAGSESAFADLMNQEAAKLGMTNTHFMNSTGLPDPNHYTTAHDIALLLRAIIKQFPDDYKRYAVREFTYNNITQQNRNRMLGLDESVDGGKTGYTNNAGYCLAASAKRGDMRLVSVVLGAKRERERVIATQALLNYGFHFYETHPVYEADKPLTEVRLWKGTVNKLPLGVIETLYVTVPKGKFPEVHAGFQADKVTITAPVTRGTPFGNITVTMGDKTLVNTPLVALQDVPRAGFFKRLWDTLWYPVYALFHW
jgi:D-alanyl-D-alanine carboxypeptidase (penicillin-binding protein 5/6)